MIDTTLKPAAIIYREDQFFAFWVYLLIGFLGLKILVPDLLQIRTLNEIRLSSDPADYGVLSVLGLITACILKMVTEVSPQGISVSFGWIPIYRKQIALHQIKSVEPCTYKPLVETLGWGIRRSWKGENVLSARGNRAVRLTCKDGSVFLIGSQRNDELASVIESTRSSMMIL